MNSCTLNGSASYDPDGAIVSYLWAKVGGPASFSIVSSNAVQTSVINMSEGLYLFELRVTDNKGAIGKDTVQVTVSGTAPQSCNIYGRPQYNATLTPVGTLSKARFPYVGAASGKIVYAGGAFYTAPNLFDISKHVDIYDLNTQAWTTAQLSRAREGIAVAAHGNKIFFAGGGFFGTIFGDNIINVPYDEVDIYDAVTNTWTTAKLTEPRAYLAAAVAGNKVLFAGGLTIDGPYSPRPSNRVDIYDISSNSWTVATLSEPRVNLHAVTVGDKVYIAGGYNGLVPSARVDIYNAVTNTWTTSSLQGLTGSVSGVSKGDQIFWAGQASSQGSIIGRAEIWNTTTGAVTTECLFYSRNAPVPVVRGHEVAFFVDNAWWVDAAVISNKFDIYNTQTGQWCIGVMPQSFASPAIISVNNTVYMGGGKTAVYTNTDKVYRVDW